MAETKRSLARGIVAIPAEIVVGIYVIADTIVWTVFAPVVRWLSRLQIVKAIERWIDSLHPYVILVLLVVPFVIAELAKVYAVYLMGTGVFKIGMTIFIGAYVVSIFVCERILHAGKRKLMTIPWFALIYNWIMAIKDAILAWFRETWVWKAAAELKGKMAVAMRGMKDRVLALFGRKPKSDEPKPYQLKSTEPKSFEPERRSLESLQPKPWEPRSLEPKPFEHQPDRVLERS